jgi:glycosyltransferase involved in cell wall biosynthesis
MAAARERRSQAAQVPEHGPRAVMRDSHLTVVIPAFNEAARIGLTLQRILAYFDSQLWDGDIIVVLDGGRDGTGEEVRRVSGTDPRVAILDNEVNRGKGFSVRRGMLAARGRLLLFSDADLSTPIEEAPRLMAAIDAGADIAIASRALAASNVQVHQPWWRESMGRVFNWFVQRLALPGIKDSQCGFKCFRRDVAHRVFALQRVERFAFDVEVLSIARSLGYRITEVPVTWIDQPASTVNPVTAPAGMLLDLVRIRMNHALGRYRERISR